MNKKNLIILGVLIMAVLVMSPAWAPQDGKRDIQAVLVKVINNVDKQVPTKGWTDAIRYDQLGAGYQVRTEAKSIAVIQFVDKSKLVVRPKSIAEIKGTVQGKEILDRSVHMTRGGIKFDVHKGQKEQFRFTSPISVASIRGTSGDWAQTDSLTRYVMLRGLLNLLSSISNRSEDVGAGQTGTTDIDGNLNVRPSTNDEKEGAEQTEDDATKTQHELRIRGEDKDGNQRTIILRWEE